jgi:conjugative relaxase-like TrwC/TraI family protein
MLSIGAMGHGQGRYYTSLAGEDYYLDGGEPPGRWMGSGAAALGLHGQVDAKTLRRLLDGFAPDGTPLVKNAGHEKHRPGWDLTFSADKSLSLLWAFADYETRKQIEEAVLTAVDRTIRQYIEKEAAFCRVGKGGHEKVPAQVVAAVFPHGTSRALDPELHFHALFTNLGVCPDGKVRTLADRELYRHKMTSGVYFRVDTEHEVKGRWHLEVERPLDSKGNPKNVWRLKTVPVEQTRFFSKRRQEIEKQLGADGLESAAAAAVACLKTRPIKELIPPRKELYRIWRQQAEQQGFSLDWVRRTLKPSRGQQQDSAAQYREALAAAVSKITAERSHFTKRDLVCHTLEEAQGRGLAADFVHGRVLHDLKHDRQFVNLGTHKGITCYTTQEVLRIEKELLDAADSLHRSSFKAISSKKVDRVLAKEWIAQTSRKKNRFHTVRDKVRAKRPRTFVLNEEQQAAARHITQAPGRVKVVSGLAGTGKSALLRAAREVFEKNGYRVIGSALAGNAAKGLRESSGIESDTVRMRLMQLYPRPWRLAKHHVKQLMRAALKLRTHKHSTLRIDRKTVFIVDEAGMVGTRDFALIAKAVERGGGILVCVGDEKQLPSIDAGGGFESLLKRFGGPRLTEITRQENIEERRAVEHLSRGEAEPFLKTHASRGNLIVAENRDTAQRQLIADWTSGGGVHSPQNHRIFVATNREADEYNLLAQRERMRAGKLSEQKVTVDRTTYYRGDRLMFVEKSRRLGIENGDTGTIVAMRHTLLGDQIAVKLDGENRTVIVSTSGRRAYRAVRLAYAFTTHKMQGATVDHAYIHLGGHMTSREMAYVQGSRHRKTLRLYTDENEAGEALTKLAREHTSDQPQIDSADLSDSPVVRQMKRSDAQQLAHDIREQARREEPLTLKIEP